MPLLLAPYNDAMRLGMGFNSYTQTMCIDSVVEATDKNTITSENPALKTTYSLNLVERVSDIVDTMDISRADTIKTGRTEVHGHANTLDQARIDDADISFMISVRVTKQTVSLNSLVRFFPIDGLEVGSPQFNEAFGDSYISGFIRGGLFIMIILFRSLNAETKERMIQAVKEVSTYSTIDLDKVRKELVDISVIQGVRLSIPTICAGGGHFEGGKSACDIASVIEAANKFPASVAKNPHKTWVKLTKYKANRSFNEWLTNQTLRPLDYDGVASYTSRLFDNYMQYKHLSRKVQDIISHRDKYSQVDKPRALSLQLNTLLAVRSALDNEMNKIAVVVNTLTRHPELLPKIEYLNTNPKDKLVQGIINEALSESSQSVSREESSARDHYSLPYVADYSPSKASSSMGEIHTPETSDLDSASLSGRSLVFLDKLEPSTDLTMHVLVPPEVWADLLPVKNDPTTSLTSKQTKTVTASNGKYKKLQILAAVCGIHDVAVRLQQWVSPGQTGDRLVIPVKDISTLEDHDSHGGLTPRIMVSLSFIYKYTDGPMRICSFDHDEQSTETLEITHQSEYQRARFVHTSRRGWSILGVTYGGKVYSSTEDLRRFVDNADYVIQGDWPYIHFDHETIKDEHLGKDDMKGVVFYTYAIFYGIQSAVSMGTAGCMLTDQRQLATVTGETVKGAKDNWFEKESKEVKPYQIILGKGIESPGYFCTFQHGTLKVRPSESPFLQFENGFKFVFRNNGRFEVLDEHDEVFWSSEEAPEGEFPRLLEFGRDGRLCLWNTDGQVYWSPLMPGIRCERTLVFSSQFPYLEICDSERKQLWRACGLHLL